MNKTLGEITKTEWQEIITRFEFVKEAFNTAEMQTFADVLNETTEYRLEIEDNLHFLIKLLKQMKKNARQ